MIYVESKNYIDTSYFSGNKFHCYGIYFCIDV